MTVYMLADPRRFGYKRLETDDELKARVLAKWGRSDTWAEEVRNAWKERLDDLAWRLVALQRRIIDVY